MTQGNDQTQTAGSRYDDIVVSVLDSRGNPLIGALVEFAVIDPGDQKAKVRTMWTTWLDKDMETTDLNGRASAEAIAGTVSSQVRVKVIPPAAPQHQCDDLAPADIVVNLLVQ